MRQPVIRRNPDMIDSSSSGSTTSGVRRGYSFAGHMRHYLFLHLQALLSTLGQLVDKPVATLMTTMVIGIALTMPTGLHLLLKNGQAILEQMDTNTQVSLFLFRDVTEERIARIVTELRARKDVGDVTHISKEEALTDFRNHASFAGVLDLFEDNPLPDLLLVTPAVLHDDPVAIHRLVNQLATLPEVEVAQLDMEWVKRLFAIISVGERGVAIISVLLFIAVLLVVGNTIRLSIQNRRDEIIIIKLIGATNSFIHRPFLYTGFWYGLSGGLVSVILVEGSLQLIRAPIDELAQLYHSSFVLQGLTTNTLMQLLTVSALLGLIGSWIAVNRHLKEIEPT